MNLGALVRTVLHWTRMHPRRLLVAPRLHLGAEGAPGEAGGEATVRVRGMVCALCAQRTGAALAAVPGVEEARVDLDTGVARLRLTPGTRRDRALEEALQGALDGVVVGLGARRWVERLARAAHAVRGGGAG